jgi:hypothetical protein
VSLFYVYAADGVIVRTGSCAESDVALQAMAGETAVVADVAVDDAAVYFDVSANSLADKAPCPFTLSSPQVVADGIDELELSDLPDPCWVVWPDGVETEVAGGSIQYSVDYAGIYTFKLSSPISLETEVSVEAIAVS